MCLMLRDTARVASVHALPATISNPAFARPSLSGAPHSIFEFFPHNDRGSTRRGGKWSCTTSSIYFAAGWLL